MAHEPDDPLAHEPLKQVCADFIVASIVIRVGFAHIVKERRGPQIRVLRVAPRHIEGLERVIKRIPFRVVAQVLVHSIERTQEVEQFRVKHS